jgi:UDP-N-acetylmuramate-alanine ligase
LADLPAAVAAIARSGDVVITLGAGSIGSAGDRILAALSASDTNGAATTKGGSAP